MNAPLRDACSLQRPYDACVLRAMHPHSTLSRDTVFEVALSNSHFKSRRSNSLAEHER